MTEPCNGLIGYMLKVGLLYCNNSEILECGLDKNDTAGVLLSLHCAFRFCI